MRSAPTYPQSFTALRFQTLINIGIIWMPVFIVLSKGKKFFWLLKYFFWLQFEFRFKVLWPNSNSVGRISSPELRYIFCQGFKSCAIFTFSRMGCQYSVDGLVLWWTSNHSFIDIHYFERVTKWWNLLFPVLDLCGPRVLFHLGYPWSINFATKLPQLIQTKACKGHISCVHRYYVHPCTVWTPRCGHGVCNKDIRVWLSSIIFW